MPIIYSLIILCTIIKKDKNIAGTSKPWSMRRGRCADTHALSTCPCSILSKAQTASYTAYTYTAYIGAFVVITANFPKFEHFGFSMSLKEADENANNADPY